MLKVGDEPVNRSAKLRLQDTNPHVDVSHIRYEGKTIGYPMDFTFVNCDPYMLSLVKESLGEIPPSLVGYTRSGASLSSLQANIKSYDRVYPGIPKDDPCFQKAIRLAYSRFRVDRIDQVPLSESSFWPDKSAGWTWLGKKKGDVYKSALVLADKIKGLAEKQRVNFKYIPPCVAFVRTQLATVDDPKVRLVWGFPFELTLLEGMFAGPLLRSYSMSNVPMYIGKSFLHGLPMKIDGMFIDNTHCNVVDWSSFDGSVSPDLIRIAFGVLQQNFKFDRETRNLWKFLISYFIYTPIVFPNGDVYTKKGGIPSGSYFTSLIGSIVNFILITYLRMKLGNKETEMYVLGDDSLFGSDSPEDFSALSNLAEKVFGMTINPSKCVTSDNPEEIDFLGHSARGFRVTRDEVKLLRLLVYPENRVKSEAVANSRILGLLADSGGTSILLWSLYLKNMMDRSTPKVGPPGNFERYVLQVDYPETLTSPYRVLNF